MCSLSSLQEMLALPSLRAPKNQGKVNKRESNCMERSLIRACLGGRRRGGGGTKFSFASGDHNDVAARVVAECACLLVCGCKHHVYQNGVPVHFVVRKTFLALRTFSQGNKFLATVCNPMMLDKDGSPL